MKWSYGKGREMEEQAKEELQMLEAQYPNHFEFLKLELKSYIFLLQSEQQQQQDSQLDSENNNHCNNFLSWMIDTEGFSIFLAVFANPVFCIPFSSETHLPFSKSY